MLLLITTLFTLIHDEELVNYSKTILNDKKDTYYVLYYFI